MTKQQAIAVIKAINRHCKRAQVFQGGRQFGVDYATWCVTFPQMAIEYSRAATIIKGKAGRYLPRF